MKKYIKKILKYLLSSLGYTIQPTAILKQNREEHQLLVSLYNSFELHVRESCPSCEGIIFSKDRVLQLHALLSSYFDFIQHPVPLNIIYYASSTAHKTAYDELISLFMNKGINFIQQKNKDTFKEQLLTLLESIEASRIFFLVDDQMFIRKFDMDIIKHLNPYKEIFSLRLGRNLSYSLMSNKKQFLPNFKEETIYGYNTMRWIWEDGQFEWSYPLSVDGHVFARPEITAMIRLIDFKAPNSLEASLQKFNQIFLERHGCCFPNTLVLNIPCNKVQNEIDNPHGLYDSEMLLRQWQNGFQINYKEFNDISNSSVHENYSISFISRGLT